MASERSSAPVNMEQLEAEFAAGCGVVRNLDVSLTTLAHLVMAAHLVMNAGGLNATAAAVLRDFAQDAERNGDFPAEMANAIRRVAEGEMT